MNYDYLNNPDPKIIAFQKALGQKESGNNPNPGGTRITKTEGSIGRFQYLPDTFKTYANKYFGGINPMTGKPLNVQDDLDQKIVNYAYVKDKIDQGYSPYDVAASWNAGEGRIDNWKTMKGVNRFGNAYDVPAYADEVVHNYRENMRQTQDPEYQARTFDKTRDSFDAYQADQDIAEQLRQQEVEREKELQAYKDKEPLIPFLDPVTDSLADFSEGIIKDSTQYIGNAATSLNELFGFSDNPMLRRGTASNDQFVNKAQESDNTTQSVGSTTGSGIRFLAEAYAGSKLADATLGSLAAGKWGNTLQKSVLGQGVAKTLARAGFSTLVQQVPFAIDDFIENGGLTFSGTTVPAAITFLAESLIQKGRIGAVGNVLDRIGKLKAVGKLDEAEKLISSSEFTTELRNKGISSLDDLEKKASEEIPLLRTTLQELVPTTSAVKVGEMSDDALKQVAANFSKTLDSNGNFNTIDDILKMRKASGQLMDSADDLANKISEHLNLVGKNVNLESFKQNIISDIYKKIASRELLPDEGKKFIEFVERNLLTKPSKAGAFSDLHKLRKQLNLDYSDNNYNAARFLGNKIRDLVKGLGEETEMVAYKNANKVYGDLQDAEYVLGKLNKKGANISKSAIASLSGILASGGGFAPVNYFLGQRMGAYLADSLKRAYTPKLVGNRFNLIGRNPLIDAQKAVKEAIELNSKRITEVKGQITVDTVRDLKQTLFNARTPEDLMKARKLIKQLAENKSVPNLDAFEDYLKKQSSKIKTRKELEEFIGTPQQWKEAEKAINTTIQVGKPGVSKFKQVDPNLPIAKDEAPKVFSNKEGQEPYTPDNELPTIDFGKKDSKAISKVKQKMIDSGANLPTILGVVIGLGALSASNPDKVAAMSEDEMTNLNFIQKMFASDPVEVTKEKISPMKEPVKQKGVIAGYDISPYATNPKHEDNIQKIYDGVTTKRDFSNAKGIQEAIKENAPKSKITGDMVLAAATKHDVDPKMLFAIMLEDSLLGTQGMGSRNNNPGNVAQFDNLKHPTKGYKTLREGVEAVAKWLKKQKQA